MKSITSLYYWAPLEAFLILFYYIYRKSRHLPQLFNNKILKIFPREVFSFLLKITCFVSNPMSSIMSGRFHPVVFNYLWPLVAQS